MRARVWACMSVCCACPCLSVCVCVCVFICSCVRVCDRERERENEREGASMCQGSFFIIKLPADFSILDLKEITSTTLPQESVAELSAKP